MSRLRILALALPVLALAASFTSASQAAIIPVTSRTSLGGNLTVDWGIFGLPGTAISTYAAAPVPPLVVHINTASGTLFRHQEGLDFTGIFMPGDQLLSQSSSNLSDPILVGFDQPVAAVGAQVQALPGGVFTGIMDVFDPSGTLLGEVTAPGNNTGTADGSAPFVGAISTSADIGFVVFSAARGNPLFPKEGDVAVNAVSVFYPVPEPASAGLLAVALLGLGIAARRWPG